MFSSHSLLVPLFGSVATALNLWATHSAGTLIHLSFKDNALTQVSSTPTDTKQPSWITYDNTSHVLYISGEEVSVAATGSLVSFSVNPDGSVAASGRASTPSDVVATGLYGGPDGKSFIANVHYHLSLLTTFKLPLSLEEQPLQRIKFTGKGPVVERQDTSHPHQVLVDPTGDFLLVPDLGADLIHIHKIDKESGKLTECPPAKPPPGTGPRHGVFWSPTVTSSRVRRTTKATTLFVANELGNTISAWAVSYPSSGDCMSLTLEQTLSPYKDNAPAPAGTKVGAIVLRGNFVYISNRNDLKFGPNDSITQFSISSDGKLTWIANTSAYGVFPRTMDINKDGDYIAIGNQVSSNVAIVPRDPVTGLVGECVADLKIIVDGMPVNKNRVRALVWAD